RLVVVLAVAAAHGGLSIAERIPDNPNPRRQIVAVIGHAGRILECRLGVVPQTEVEGQDRPQAPRILHESRIEIVAALQVRIADILRELERIGREIGGVERSVGPELERPVDVVEEIALDLNQADVEAGFDISLIQVKSYFFNNVDGTFQFRTDGPFNAADLSTYPFQFTQDVGDPNLQRRNDLYAGFMQDTWRLRSILSFNLGLRYDTETAFKDAAGVPDDRNNLAPRIGVVWDPFRDGKTAVRGGYGKYYDQA